MLIYFNFMEELGIKRYLKWPSRVASSIWRSWLLVLPRSCSAATLRNLLSFITFTCKITSWITSLVSWTTCTCAVPVTEMGTPSLVRTAVHRGSE